MGAVNAQVKLTNPRIPELSPLQTAALADTGATHLCIPERVMHQLKLDVLEMRDISLADGTIRSVRYVGPIQIQFENRTGFTGALVLGDQVLLGLIPMEDMDLVVLPKTRRIAVNPLSPNVPMSRA